MGGYIGNPSDLQIVAALNLAFGAGSSGLAKTRTYFGAETPFDDQHTLSRVAFRLNGYPNDPTSKAKWFGLLDNLKSSEAAKIQDVLGDALANQNIQAVVFAVMPDPGNGKDYSVMTDKAVNGASYITLLCPQHDYKGPQHDDPPPDKGEPHGVKPIRKPRATKKGKAAKSGKKSKKSKKRK